MELSKLKLINVIDIATGVGQFIHYLLEENTGIESIIGVDTCQRSIEQAEKSFSDPRVTFAIANAVSLEYADESFSGVTINNSLHHFEDIKGVLSESKRVLLPNGYLIVNEMCNDEGQSLAQQSHIKIHHWFAELDTLMKRYHDYTYSTKKISHLISNNGFKIIHQEIYDSEIANPKDINLIENYIKTIIAMQKRAEANNAPIAFLEQADKIIEDLKQYGFSPARNILIIAQKA